MTMVPMYKKCPRCKRKYSWNPDVGKTWCPYCGLQGIPRARDLSLKKIKKKEKMKSRMVHI